MKPSLNLNLVYLYAAAMVATVRNRSHAKKALREGKPILARLLNALESSESAHARRFLMYLRGKTSESDDFLKEYRKSKETEIAPGYTAMAHYYEQTGKIGKAKNFHEFERVVAAQANLIARYQAENEDMPGGVYVCQVCGFVTTVQPTVNCPVCNAVNDKFDRFGSI